MKQLVLLLSIMVFSVTVEAEISMKQAIIRGINLSKTCKNGVVELDSLRLEKSMAKLDKRFVLESAGSYVYKSDQPEIIQPESTLAPGLVIPGYRKPVGTKHIMDFSVSLHQPLYTGNILTNRVRLKEVESVIAEKRYHFFKLQTAAQIKISYFNYWLLKQSEASLMTLIQKLELHRQRLEHFYQQELVKKSDLLETAAKINEKKLTLEDLRQQIDSERIHFKTLCECSVEELEKGYSESIGDVKKSLLDFEAYNPIIQSLDARLAAMKLGRKIKQGEYAPRVSAFAELHYGKPGIDFFQNDWALYFQGGLAISWKIFDWNKKARAMQNIDNEAKKIDNERLDYIREGHKKITQLYGRKKAAEKKLETVRKLIGIASEDIVLKKNLLDEQQISNIDYLTALIEKERYILLANQERFKLALIGVNINNLIGKSEDEK